MFLAHLSVVWNWISQKKTFWCELSKPVRQTAWKAEFQQAGTYSVYALLIKNQTPGTKWVLMMITL